MANRFIRDAWPSFEITDGERKRNWAGSLLTFVFGPSSTSWINPAVMLLAEVSFLINMKHYNRFSGAFYVHRYLPGNSRQGQCHIVFSSMNCRPLMTEKTLVLVSGYIECFL